MNTDMWVFVIYGVHYGTDGLSPALLFGFSRDGVSGGKSHVMGTLRNSRYSTDCAALTLSDKKAGEL